VDKVVQVTVLPGVLGAAILLAAALVGPAEAVGRAVLELPAVVEDLVGSDRRLNLSRPIR
jgi:hypothetical protein